MEKVAPSERFRCELDELLAGVVGEDDPIEVVGRLGARLICSRRWRTRSRSSSAGGGMTRWRGGQSPQRARTQDGETTSGSMALERPRVRNASKLGFESWVLGKGVTRTHALESLVISGFLRGLSTRDLNGMVAALLASPFVGYRSAPRGAAQLTTIERITRLIDSLRDMPPAVAIAVVNDKAMSTKIGEETGPAVIEQMIEDALSTKAHELEAN